MTTIVYSDFRLSATGHTGYSKPGADIVCAGVSTLTQVLVRQVLAARDAGWLARPPVVIVMSGNVRISCKPKPKHKAEMAFLWKSVLDGLGMIAHAYPEYVVIKSARSD